MSHALPVVLQEQSQSDLQLFKVGSFAFQSNPYCYQSIRTKSEPGSLWFSYKHKFGQIFSFSRQDPLIFHLTATKVSEPGLNRGILGCLMHYLLSCKHKVSRTCSFLRQDPLPYNLTPTPTPTATKVLAPGLNQRLLSSLTSSFSEQHLLPPNLTPTLHQILQSQLF